MDFMYFAEKVIVAARPSILGRPRTLKSTKRVANLPTARTFGRYCPDPAQNPRMPRTVCVVCGRNFFSLGTGKQHLYSDSGRAHYVLCTRVMLRAL